MRKVFRSLISLEEARSLVLGSLPVPELETVPLDLALGRILGEKIVSDIDVPGFSRASMDGYAVLAADTIEAREDQPVRLALSGNVPMGAMAGVQVGRGMAAEVSTGSMMPPGADAVVMIENAEASGLEVLIRRPVHTGENMQAAGMDIMLGESVLMPGTVLTAREIGVLAAVGRSEATVRRLKVGIASTGNELVEPGKTLKSGQIYDINSYTISAAARDCGANTIRYGILSDDYDSLSEALMKISAECSMVLVSGSTSAGVGDMVYQVLDDLGQTVFHGINLKPGKPTIFGTLNGKPFLGLPGYPTSALTVFEELAAPAIRKSLGLRSPGYRLKGKMAMPVRSESRRQMLPVGVKGDLVYPVDKGSGSITTLSRADGVVEIPAEVEYLDKGDSVEVRLFSEHVEPDLVLAGEDCPLVDILAELLPFQIRRAANGNRRGMISVEDGLADVALISSPLPENENEMPKVPEGLVLINGYTRELGLMAKDLEVHKTGNKELKMVGWQRDSAMSEMLPKALKDIGLNPDAVVFSGRARSHSAVAAAVASGRADLGFGSRVSAEAAGLEFERLVCDRIDFLTSHLGKDKDSFKALLAVLNSEGLKH